MPVDGLSKDAFYELEEQAKRTKAILNATSGLSPDCVKACIEETKSRNPHDPSMALHPVTSP